VGILIRTQQNRKLVPIRSLVVRPRKEKKIGNFLTKGETNDGHAAVAENAGTVGRRLEVRACGRKGVLNATLKGTLRQNRTYRVLVAIDWTPTALKARGRGDNKM